MNNKRSWTNLFNLFIVSLFLLTACTVASNNEMEEEIAQRVEETIQAQNAGMDPVTLKETAEEANIQIAQATQEGQRLNTKGKEQEDATPTTISKPTPFPTFTPRSPIHPTVGPEFDNNPRGFVSAILDTYSGNVFMFPEVTLLQVNSYPAVGHDEPDVGDTYIYLEVQMKNVRDTLAVYSDSGFQIFDDNGLSHDPEYAFIDCLIYEDREVLPGGVLQGCLLFQVPNDGHFNLVYAPYRSDRFGDNRFLNWEIQYNPEQGPGIIEPEVRISAQSTYRPSFENAWAYTYGNRITCEMQFTGEDTISDLQISIRTFDAQNRMLETLEGVIWQEILLPGDKVIFWAESSEGVWNVTDMDLIVSADQADFNSQTAVYREFLMQDFRLQQTDSVWYEMIGNVENVGDAGVIGLGIHVIAYDKDGNIIGYDQGVAGFDTDEFTPGMVSPVEGQMRIFHPAGQEAVDHFDFLFDAHK